MEEVVFKNLIYVSFDKLVDISEYHSSTEKEKEYYKKYKAGGLTVLFKNKSLSIIPEDINYLYNDLLLKNFIAVYNGENVRQDLWEKELFVLDLVTTVDKDLKIIEYSRRDNETSQELIVPKGLFLKELYKNILLFNEFYSKAHNEDLSFWDEKIEEVKTLLEA